MPEPDAASRPALDESAAKEQSAESVLAALESRADGLSAEQAASRLRALGPNRLPEARRGGLARLLRYVWAPIPWMIEVAALLSALVRHWADFVIIVLLLLFNAGVGFWQEYKAASALDALKRQLAMKARVRRDGTWASCDAAVLVPGDVVRVRLGDIVPADIKLLDGDYLSVDQSALTGESLPVERRAGGVIYSGSIARQGEMTGVVFATGARTYLGRTAPWCRRPVRPRISSRRCCRSAIT